MEGSIFSSSLTSIENHHQVAVKGKRRDLTELKLCGNIEKSTIKTLVDILNKALTSGSKLIAIELMHVTNVEAVGWKNINDFQDLVRKKDGHVILVGTTHKHHQSLRALGFHNKFKLIKNLKSWMQELERINGKAKQNDPPAKAPYQEQKGINSASDLLDSDRDFDPDEDFDDDEASQIIPTIELHLDSPLLRDDDEKEDEDSYDEYDELEEEESKDSEDFEDITATYLSDETSPKKSKRNKKTSSKSKQSFMDQSLDEFEALDSSELKQFKAGQFGEWLYPILIIGLFALVILVVLPSFDLLAANSLMDFTQTFAYYVGAPFASLYLIILLLSNLVKPYELSE